MVIQAHDGFALHAAHELRHPLVLAERKIDAVPLGLPIRRGEVEQRVRPVVALDAVGPVQVSMYVPARRRCAALNDSSMRSRFGAGAVVAVPNVRPSSLAPKHVCCR